MAKDMKGNEIEIGGLVMILDPDRPEVDGQSAILTDYDASALFPYTVRLLVGENAIWHTTNVVAHYESEMNQTQKNMHDKMKKAPLAEVHPQFERSLAECFTVSVEKGYVPNNWLDTELVPTMSLINAARRHINEYLSGNLWNHEPGCETQTLHLENAAYSLLMAATQIRESQNEKS